MEAVAPSTSTFACAALLSFGWSPQGGVSLSVDKAQAYTRVVVRPYVRGVARVPWYAVRSYYADGPWSGPNYAGWSDYAARNGIVCAPGTVIKGGDGILYMCQ
jgi:hypothetical protein